MFYTEALSDLASNYFQSFWWKVFSVNTQSSSSKVNRLLKKYRSKSWTSRWYSISLVGSYQADSRHSPLSQQELVVKISRNFYNRRSGRIVQIPTYHRWPQFNPPKSVWEIGFQHMVEKQGISSSLMPEPFFLWVILMASICALMIASSQ